MNQFIENRKAEIEKEIEACQDLIADFPLTVAESEEDLEEWSSRMEEEGVTFAVSERGNQLFENAQAAMASRTITRLQKTLDTDLMQVRTRYVLTNTERLESPAGFHPDTKVFVKTDVAYCVNRIERKHMATRGLYAHEIN